MIYNVDSTNFVLINSLIGTVDLAHYIFVECDEIKWCFNN